MKAKITALNKEYLVEFKNDDQFISFMTTHNDKINNIEIINESELPATSKSVEMVKISKPTGWTTLEKSSFVTKEKNVEKKGMTLGGKYGEFKYEPNKNLESSTTDKVSDSETESPALKGEEPKTSSVENTKEVSNQSFKSSATKKESSEDNSDEDNSDEDKKELDEGLLDILKDGYKKLNGSPNENEISELVNEYLVYAFMDICGKVSYEENPTYQRIVKSLTKADKKFVRFADAIRTFIANATAKFEMPLKRVDMLAKKLVQVGVDREIVEKAKSTFMNEEMNSENYNESIEKPTMDDVDFEDDLTDADREMYTSEVQHILDIWDELSSEEQKQLKDLMFNKKEKETLNEKGCLEEFNHPMINNGSVQQDTSNDNEFQVNIGDVFLDNNGNEITVKEIGEEQVNDNVGGKGRLVKLTNTGGENIQMPSSVLANNYKRKEDKITESEGEDFEQYEICAWCEDKLPKSSMKKEEDLGWLCNHCEKAISSRGEELHFEND